jgi:hypothetical protein
MKNVRQENDGAPGKHNRSRTPSDRQQTADSAVIKIQDLTNYQQETNPSFIHSPKTNHERQLQSRRNNHSCRTRKSLHPNSRQKCPISQVEECQGEHDLF